jgi:hypothetical protein
MATDTDWLDRLDNVFDYQALQKLFGEIADRAVAEREDTGLAKKIDEVIRRIEEERAADQTALDEIKGRYETFQQDNRGFVGWFKRHLPFSEARRQDVHHRSGLADQQAEVLADNLVIARAQMLKERFLGPAERKLGHRTGHWQSELDAAASVAQLAAISASLRSLAPEIDQSRAFVELLRRDIDAFATAAFRAKEDRVRRDGDLAAARGELAELAKEVGQKEKLKRDALKRLGHLVTEELTATDSAFRDDSRRLTELESLGERLRAARETLGQLKAAAEKIGALNKELHAIPEQLQQLRVERQQAEQCQTDAAVADARKTAVADERRARCDEARRRVDQARQSLAAIEQADAAWRAGHTPEKTMSQMVEAAPDQSPHAAHRREAQAALNMAQTAFQEASQSFEMAKQDAQQGRSAVEAGTGQLATIDARIAAIEQRRAQLQHEAPQSSLAGQAAFAKAAAALATFLDAAPALSGAPDSPPYGCVSGNQLNAAWGDALLHADRDVTRHLQAIALLEQLSQWQQSRQRELDQNREAIAGRRSAAWKRRCSDLLGNALAGEAPLVQ